MFDSYSWKYGKFSNPLYFYCFSFSIQNNTHAHTHVHTHTMHMCMHIPCTHIGSRSRQNIKFGFWRNLLHTFWSWGTNLSFIWSKTCVVTWETDEVGAGETIIYKISIFMQRTQVYIERKNDIAFFPRI